MYFVRNCNRRWRKREPSEIRIEIASHNLQKPAESVTTLIGDLVLLALLDGRLLDLGLFLGGERPALPSFRFNWLPLRLIVTMS